MVERALELDGVRLHLGAEITDLLERQGVSASRLHRAKYRDDQAAEGRGRMKRTFSD